MWVWSIMNECGTLTSTEHPTVDVGLVRTSPSDIRLTKELLPTPGGNIQYQRVFL